jgi:protein-serine/threonine kinase
MFDASETAQTEGDGPEGSDKPGISNNKLFLKYTNSQRPRAPSTGARSTSARSNRSTGTSNGTPTPTSNRTISSAHHPSVPLPPPEAGAFPKEPGHTKGSLGKLVLQSTEHNKNVPPVRGSETPSTVDSPTGSDSDSWGHSTTSTRPPSRVPSRAPSMSRGKSGAEADRISKTPVATAKKEPDSAAIVAAALEKTKLSKAVVAAEVVPSAPPSKPPSRPPSVNSDSGHHRFTLKDLLANGPKLNRRSSARSTASSKKSDSDGERRSTAGESTASLSKKYGVCERVAIGKGATSVVRLAHKWDHQEEKLYAVKVRVSATVDPPNVLGPLTFGAIRNSASAGRTRLRRNMSRSLRPSSASPQPCTMRTSSRPWI